MLERGPGGEEFPRCLSPTPANVYPMTGIGSRKPLLEHRAPPGRGTTRIIMLVNHGGKATQPRAPGHDRPHAALRAAWHGRLSAASTAPGADIPPASTAGAPGQYCQSAAPRAPGHGRTLAIAAGAPCRDRLSAALRAPGADLLLASTAKAAGHHRPSAAPIATVSLPTGPRRLRQEGLPHTPANPRTLTNPHTHRLNHHSRLPSRHCGVGRNPRPPVATGGPQGGDPAHPAIQVPPQPRSCSTAHTGLSLHHPSRAPPAPPPSLRPKHAPYPDTGPQSSRTIE